MVEDDKSTIKRIGTFMAKPSGTTPKRSLWRRPILPVILHWASFAKANESVHLNESHSNRIFQIYPG